MEIFKKIFIERIQNKILEYVVYPQPYLNEVSKLEIFNEAKRRNLKNCKIFCINPWICLLQDSFNIIIYDDLHQIVNIDFPTNYENYTASLTHYMAYIYFM